MAKQDRESFYQFAKRIEEVKLQPLFMSTQLSPQVFLRLGQLQDPDGCLLPSLRHLYISENPYLDHLDVFLSPSLRTLEISPLSTNINHCGLTSFLDSAVELSSDLETLILVDPCELPRKVFDSCSKFGQLRHLELIDVVASAIDPLLHNMGSLEQHLDRFVLQERRNPSLKMYSSRNTANSVQTSVVDGLPGVIEVPTSDAVTAPALGVTSRSPVPSTAGTRTPFAVSQGLRTLKITGTSDLVEKVVSAITSPALHDLCVTFTTNTPRVTEVTKTKKRKGKAEDMGKKSAKSMEKVVDSVTYILSIAIDRWKALASINVKADTRKTVFLPEDVFRHLLLQPGVRRLEITNFDISSVDSALSNLAAQHHISQLEILLLPTNCSHSISFYRLQEIAEACPKLTSLRCVVDSAGLVPQLSDPMSHQLHELSVVSDNIGGPDLQHVSLVASFIDSLFPNLAKMAVEVESTRAEYGREWLQVFGMVKLFQTARAQERRRLSIM